MGRRSRKRMGDSGSLGSASPPRGGSPPDTPAPRRPPTATRRKTRFEDRPPAPWGDFPLGELVTFAGIVVLVVGFATTTFRLMALGFALIALSAVELTVREHFAGFRSHSSLLALVAGALTAVILVALQVPRALEVSIAAGVLVGAFIALRRTFQRRSGGLGFRA
jgi:hypothetical protein